MLYDSTRSQCAFDTSEALAAAAVNRQHLHCSSSWTNVQLQCRCCTCFMGKLPIRLLNSAFMAETLLPALLLCRPSCVDRHRVLLGAGGRTHGRCARCKGVCPHAGGGRQPHARGAHHRRDPGTASVPVAEGVVTRAGHTCWYRTVVTAANSAHNLLPLSLRGPADLQCICCAFWPASFS